MRGDYNYAVQGFTAVCDVQQGAAARCRTPIVDAEWDEIERVSHLTDRCILEGATHENLCWKHRGMMEFYCGLHLARNSQQDWGTDQVVSWSNDPEWYWAWRFAIELTPDVWQARPQTLVQSLAALYRRPEPGKGRRPGELMYRAWSVLESVPGGRQVLDDFQDEFWQLFRAGDPIAQQLVPEATLVRMGLLTEQDAADRSAAERNFVRCPPEQAGIDHQPFWMGTAEEVVEELGRDGGYSSGDERPRHRVIVSPFLLQTTPVTCGQYALYDPEHQPAYAEDFAMFAPQPDSPVIYVDWYDAWVFAHWIGGTLPNDAQWEYACRAGRDGPRDFFHVGDSLTSGQANFRGNYPYPMTADKGPYLGRTSAVRTYPENAWGVYDLHGNVREWCDDWYNSEYYEQLAETGGHEPIQDPSGPPAGSSRVLRGGSWDLNADFCRSAYRYNYLPSDRNDFIGFRLLCSCSLSRPSRPQ